MKQYIITGYHRQSGAQMQWIFNDDVQAGDAYSKLKKGAGCEFKHLDGKTYIFPAEFIGWTMSPADEVFEKIAWFTEHNIRAQQKGQSASQKPTGGLVRATMGSPVDISKLNG